MKYLINQIIIIILINLTCLNTQSAQAQSVIFEYDAAGNRVLRSAESPCNSEPPEAPRVLNTIENGVAISWYTHEAITGLQYKKEGGNWQTYTTTQPFAQLSNLQSCQSYFTRLQYSCAGSVKYTPQVSFTTKGCSNNCTANDIEIHTTPNPRGMFVHWDIYPGASYILHFRKAGESRFIPVETADHFATLSALLTCTAYEFSLQVKCTGGQVSPFGKVFNFSTTGCRLSDEAVAPTVAVYPNPAQSHITIQLNNNKPIDLLTIYNSSLQLVRRIQPRAGQRHYGLNVADLASGIYLIKAQMGDIVETTKFSMQ